ncbi:MAG: GTPase HflX [Eubacteriales bacterium]|nr:GTPase HflX [Eubacteriales bacterium]
MNEEIKIKGNIAGIRNAVLQDMEKLFAMDMELLRHEFVSQPLLTALCDLTARCNREVMVYVARDGLVLEVIVGQNDRVDLPEIQVRRGKRRLSGIRCIHTHPSGGAGLSEIDLQALRRMRFDAMASIGVYEGAATGMEVAYLEDIDAAGEYVLSRTGVLDLANLSQDALLNVIEANDARILQAARILTSQESTEERAILVGIDSEESLDELERLADTAGAVVLEKFFQNKALPDPALFIGRGKVGDLALVRQLREANLFIFDDELSGAQIRNLEQELGCKVIDRTTLILDIFAGRATSREGRLQVELAQYKYRYPRLTGAGSALSRLAGGIGTRGPGESKLEVDRRYIRRRINDLEKEVRELEKQRTVRRQRRIRTGIATAALVGYTNAGKSSLLNALSGSDVLAEDKLFATLDPITRRISIEGRPVLLTDTVGFIKKLPHDLVSAFRSTLEEALHADVLLHVVDVSSPEAYEQYRVAEDVLDSLGAKDAPRVVALNKADALQGVADMPFDTAGAPRVAVSALTGQGLEELRRTVLQQLDSALTEKEYVIPYDKSALLSRLHGTGQVLATDYRDEGTYIKLQLDRDNIARLGQEYAQYERPPV